MWWFLNFVVQPIYWLFMITNLLALYLLTALKNLISMVNLKSDYMFRMTEINAARPVFNDVTVTFFPCAFLDSHHFFAFFTLEKRNWNPFYLFAFDREKISLKSFRFSITYPTGIRWEGLPLIGFAIDFSEFLTRFYAEFISLW